MLCHADACSFVVLVVEQYV